jgi:hypothetical protein
MMAIYRVRKLNLSSKQIFSKNAIKQLFFNKFLRNLQVMFIGSCLIHLLKEIAAGSHHGLNSLAETPAGHRHGVPGEGGHHLRDLRLERVRSVVWGFVNISVTNAPNIIVQGIAVEAAGRPDLLRPELGEVRRAPILCDLGVVSRGAILLKDVMAPISSSVHPGLDHLLQELKILVGIDLQSLGEEVGGGITSPSLLTTPGTITVAGNLVLMTIGTLLMSKHNHLLFLQFTFWSWEKFFSSEKKINCPLAAGFFSLFRRSFAFSSRLSSVTWFINCPLLIAYDL